MGTTVQVKCLLRNGVLLLLLVNAWVHCATLTVVQRGERAEFTSSSTVARSLSLLSLVLTTLFLQREREREFNRRSLALISKEVRRYFDYR